MLPTHNGTIDLQGITSEQNQAVPIREQKNRKNLSFFSLTKNEELFKMKMDLCPKYDFDLH